MRKFPEETFTPPLAQLARTHYSSHNAIENFVVASLL